jgi:hypothetical protein
VLKKKLVALCADFIEKMKDNKYFVFLQPLSMTPTAGTLKEVRLCRGPVPLYLVHLSMV